jgi:hypothetical protein
VGKHLPFGEPWCLLCKERLTKAAQPSGSERGSQEINVGRLPRVE